MIDYISVYATFLGLWDFVTKHNCVWHYIFDFLSLVSGFGGLYHSRKDMIPHCLGRPESLLVTRYSNITIFKFSYFPFVVDLPLIYAFNSLNVFMLLEVSFRFKYSLRAAYSLRLWYSFSS